MDKRTCAIEECEREARARGWCKMHWKRWRTHGDPAYVRPSPPPSRCEVDGCESPKHSRAYCSKHYQRFVANGDPLIVGDHYPGRPRLDAPSYAGVHKRLARERGKASLNPCSDCGNTAHEWSYDGGCPNELTSDYRGTTLTYSTNLDTYSPRCRRCHRAMDDSLKRGRDSAGRWAPHAA